MPSRPVVTQGTVPVDGSGFALALAQSLAGMAGIPADPAWSAPSAPSVGNALGTAVGTAVGVALAKDAAAHVRDGVPRPPRSPGATHGKGHWVTIHGRNVYITDDGLFHFHGEGSPGIDPDAADFGARVNDSLAAGRNPRMGHAAGATASGIGVPDPDDRAPRFSLRHLTGNASSLRQVDEADVADPQFPVAHLRADGGAYVVTHGHAPQSGSGAITRPMGTPVTVAPGAGSANDTRMRAAQVASGLLLGAHADALRDYSHAHRAQIASGAPGHRQATFVLETPTGPSTPQVVTGVPVATARPPTDGHRASTGRASDAIMSPLPGRPGIPGHRRGAGQAEAPGADFANVIDDVLAHCDDRALAPNPTFGQLLDDGSFPVRRVMTNTRTGDRVIYERHQTRNFMAPGGRDNGQVTWRIRHLPVGHDQDDAGTRQVGVEVAGMGSEAHARALAGAVMLGGITRRHLPLSGWPAQDQGSIADGRPGAGLPTGSAGWNEVRRLGWQIAQHRAGHDRDWSPRELRTTYRDAVEEAAVTNPPRWHPQARLGQFRAPEARLPEAPDATRAGAHVPDTLHGTWPALLGGTDDLDSYFRPALAGPGDVRSIERAMPQSVWRVRLGDHAGPDGQRLVNADRNGPPRTVAPGRSLIEITHRASGIRTIGYFTEDTPAPEPAAPAAAVPGAARPVQWMDTPVGSASLAPTATATATATATSRRALAIGTAGVRPPDPSGGFRIKVIDRSGALLSENAVRLVPSAARETGRAVAPPHLVRGAAPHEEERQTATGVIGRTVQAANWAISLAERRAGAASMDRQASLSPGPVTSDPQVRLDGRLLPLTTGTYDPSRPVAQFAREYEERASGLRARPTPFPIGDDLDPEAVATYLSQAFPALADRNVQNEPHHGNSVIDHTVLGLERLATAGLSDRDRSLLRLAFAFHDVGKALGGTDARHQEYGSSMTGDHLGDFGLSPGECQIVRTLISHHHAVGDVNMGRPTSRYPGGMAMTDLAQIAHDERTGRLLTRMWATDVASIPGYRGMPVSAPGGTPRTEPLLVANDVAGLLDTELARLRASGELRPRAEPSPIRPATTAPPLPVATGQALPGVAHGEPVARIVNLAAGEPNAFHDNLAVPDRVVGEARDHPGLNYARAYGMAYDGPTGHVARVFMATPPDRVDALLASGLRLRDQGPVAGIRSFVGGADVVPRTAGQAVVMAECHVGRACSYEEARDLYGHWRDTHPAEDRSLTGDLGARGMETPAGIARACLASGYTAIHGLMGGNPVLIGLDPARFRITGIIGPDPGAPFVTSGHGAGNDLPGYPVGPASFPAAAPDERRIPRSSWHHVDWEDATRPGVTLFRPGPVTREDD